MKRIINKKVYDTETAEKIAEWDNGYYGNDFHACWEELYRTKKGQFFIHGGGGPLSSYHEQVGNTFSGGEDLFLMTDDDAYDWLEERGRTKIIETLFSDRVEEG